LFECQRVLIAHGVWITDSDMSLVAKPNLSVVLNPQCNAKLASGIAPLQKFIKNKIRFVMGTDSAASNNNTDIFVEMNFLSKLHHLTESDLTVFPALCFLMRPQENQRKLWAFKKVSEV
jgi:5-methylthioadenosine/S-adenosylhomocysteine deaminase